MLFVCFEFCIRVSFFLVGLMFAYNCSVFLVCVFFFFKQKTAYVIRLSLVGSDMCIRDSLNPYIIEKGRLKIFRRLFCGCRVSLIKNERQESIQMETFTIT